jgi:hypothetical protein
MTGGRWRQPGSGAPRGRCAREGSDGRFSRTCWCSPACHAGFDRMRSAKRSLTHCSPPFCGDLDEACDRRLLEREAALMRLECRAAGRRPWPPPPGRHTRRSLAVLSRSSRAALAGDVHPWQTPSAQPVPSFEILASAWSTSAASGAERPSRARFTRPYSACLMDANEHFRDAVDKDARRGLLIIERAENGHNSTSPRDRDRAHRAPCIRISQPGQLSCCFRLADW